MCKMKETAIKNPNVKIKNVMKLKEKMETNKDTGKKPSNRQGPRKKQRTHAYMG